jgi:hypothetical protein
MKAQENLKRNGGFVAISCYTHPVTQKDPGTQTEDSEITTEIGSEIKEHLHKMKNSDGEDYWERIEYYLEHLKVPQGIKNIRSFHPGHQALFFIPRNLVEKAQKWPITIESD